MGYNASQLYIFILLVVAYSIITFAHAESFNLALNIVLPQMPYNCLRNGTRASVNICPVNFTTGDA